ncbi:MAG: hypothetical protein ACPG5P_08190, partial [Saprospiraceae bacterium]
MHKGEGNFQANNPLHQTFIDDVMEECNKWLNLSIDFGCNIDLLPYGAKVDIVENGRYYIQDDYYWDTENCPSILCCPSHTGWYLNPLNNSIESDPNIPDGINIYFTTEKDIFEELSINGDCDTFYDSLDYNVWCSERPDFNDMNATQRIHQPNMFNRYISRMDFGCTLHYQTQQEAYDYLVGNQGRTTAHELGHTFFDMIHTEECDSLNLMTSGSIHHSPFTNTEQIGTTHQVLAL